MTNEKAIKHLEVIKGDCALVGDIRALDMAISALTVEGDLISRTEVINAIDEREDANGNVNAEDIRTDICLIPSKSDNGEWIPVSKRLPENSDYVLATDGLDIFVAWHNPEKERFKGWHSFDESFDTKVPIIAWQPLPEPYKAEKGGEE